MLNKLFNRYLLVLFGVALSFGLALNAQAADPTIHAVSNGGDWGDVNTWTEGRIPTSSDIVEINGTVNVTSDAAIAGLYVSINAILQNKSGITARITVNGDVLNNSTIQHNNDQYAFYLAVSGNITNNWVWNNSWTDLLSTQSRVIGGTHPLLSGVTFVDNFEILNSPVFDGGVNLNNKTITLASSSEGISVANNSALSGTIILSSAEQNVNLNGTITASTTVSGPGNLVISGANVKGSLTADHMIFESGLLTGTNITVNQLIVRGSGDKAIANDYVSWNIINNTTFNGSVVIETGATIHNKDWEDTRLIINGDAVNNGSISNNNHFSLYMTVSGNITNNGTWNNGWIDLSSTQSRTIGGTHPLLSGVTFVDNFEILNSPVFDGGVNLNNKTITLASSSGGISVANNSALSGTIILSSAEQNVNLNGTITASTTVSGPGNLVISGANVKGSLTADHMIFESGLLTGTNITVNQLIVRGSGNKTIIDAYVGWNTVYTVINGSLLVEEGATLQNQDWESPRLIINGSVVNNGTIKNNTNRFFYMTVSGDITNNGTWNNSWTDFSSTQSRTIDGINPISSPVTFLNNFEILGNPIFSGGTNLNDKTITLASSSESITLSGNSTLSGTIILNSANQRVNLSGVITASTTVSGPGNLVISGANVIGKITAGEIIFESGSIVGTFTADQFIARGSSEKQITSHDQWWHMIDSVINGSLKVESGATIKNMGWETPRLIVNGDVVNNGSITNNGGYSLYLNVSGNITNNGIWNNSETRISWPAVFGTTEYEVNITENNNNWPVAATTTDTSYNISNLVSSSRYWRVRPAGGYWSSVKRINVGLFGGFAFNTIDSSSQMATRPINLTITAVDINGNPYSFAGSVSLSASNNGTTTPSTITMSNGSWTGTTSISMFGNNVTLTATGGGESGTSNAFNLKKKPVIIVPGIIGTRLRASTSPYSEIWPDVYHMTASSTDDYLNELMLDNDGWPAMNSVVTTGDIIRDITVLGVNFGHFFDELIAVLENSGYSENENLFVFPYDWRLDITYIADNNFKNEIEAIKNQTGAREVDIVAHSMGGLVVEKYIKDYGRGSVDKFIDIATPHLGAPKAAKILLYGDNFDIDYGIFGLNQQKIKEISQNFSSVYQLLPSRNYFDASSTIYNGYIADLHDMDNNNVTGNLDYDESIDFLGNLGGNSTLASMNDSLHDDLDNFNPNDYGVKTYNIVGCNHPTINRIYIINKHNSDYEYGLSYVNGDGTVPLRSAEALANTTGTYYNTDTATSSTHAFLSSSYGDKELISSILNDSVNQFSLAPYPLYENNNLCVAPLDGWQISYHSPIALHIYDEQGRHVGPDAKGNIEINIPGAAYDVIGDNKFAFVPKGHNYKVIGQATGLGHFNARIQDIQKGKTVSEAYYNEVPIKSLDTNIEINFVNNKPNYEMKMDQKGDKVFREKIKPNSILNAKETEDRIKPETKAKISGQTLKLISGDDNSRVLKTEYSLDAGKTWNVYNKAIDIDQAEGLTIQYKSTDRAGNIEDVEEQTIQENNNQFNLSGPKKIRF